MDFLRLIKKGSSKSIECCANELWAMQQVINKYISKYSWYSLDNKELVTKDKDQWLSEIIKSHIKDIKRNDKIDVDKFYENEFGNTYAVSVDRSFEYFKVTYILGNISDSGSSDVLMIDNITKGISSNKEVYLGLFKDLIEIFNPDHGTISSRDLAYSIIDFATKEIWTGWMTYVSNRLISKKIEGFEMIETNEGVIYIVSNENGDPEIFNKRVCDLTHLIRQLS